MAELLAIMPGATPAPSAAPLMTGVATLLDAVPATPPNTKPNAPIDPFAALMASALIDPTAPMATAAPTVTVVPAAMIPAAAIAASLAPPELAAPAVKNAVTAAPPITRPAVRPTEADSIAADAPAGQGEGGSIDDPKPAAIDPALSPVLAMLAALQPRPEAMPAASCAPAPASPPSRPIAILARPAKPAPAIDPAPSSLAPPIATSPAIDPQDAQPAADRSVRPIIARAMPDAPAPIAGEDAAASPMARVDRTASTPLTVTIPEISPATLTRPNPAHVAAVADDAASPIEASDGTSQAETKPPASPKPGIPATAAIRSAPARIEPAASPTAPSAKPGRAEPLRIARRADDRPIDVAGPAATPAIPPARTDIAAPAITPPDAADPLVGQQLAIADDGRWLDTLARDIARSADGGDLRFKLEPVNLGSLTISIAQGTDGAAVRMTADTATARDILIDAQPMLVSEARAHGMRIAETHVDLAGSGRRGDSPAYPQSNGSQGGGQPSASQPSGQQAGGQAAMRQDAPPRRQPDLPDRHQTNRRSADSAAPTRDAGERFA